MSQRRSMAWGGPPPKGGEAFESRCRTTEARTGYFIVADAIGKRRELP